MELKRTLREFGGDRGLLMERLSGTAGAVAEVAAQDAAEASQDEGGTVPPA